jgi:hypothetical protein
MRTCLVLSQREMQWKWKAWLHMPQATVHSSLVALAWFAWHSMHRSMMWFLLNRNTDVSFFNIKRTQETFSILSLSSKYSTRQIACLPFSAHQLPVPNYLSPYHLQIAQFKKLRKERAACIAVLGIRFWSRIRMFLGLPDPDPLVRGVDPDPDPDPYFSHKGDERTEIMLAK